MVLLNLLGISTQYHIGKEWNPLKERKEKEGLQKEIDIKLPLRISFTKDDSLMAMGRNDNN